MFTTFTIEDYNFNFTNSTSQIHVYNSTFTIEDYNFNFTNSTSQIHVYNSTFTTSIFTSTTGNYT